MKKHSKDRKQQKYDRYYDNQNNDNRYYEKPEYKKDFRKHNEFPHPQQLQHHHQQQQQQYDNYQFHKKKHHGHYERQMDRQKQKMYQMSDEEFLQQNRRKFESEYKNSAEVLEQDLRSRLLSKRNKHENNEYAHHIPADYEVIDKRRDQRSPDHKKRHHHHHKEKAQAIEVIDSPETHEYDEEEELPVGDEERRRHHKKSKKQKHHKHDKSSKVKEEPEDPELVSRRSKLLLAEKEILKSKEAAEARRKEKATHEPAAPPKEVRKRHYSTAEEEDEEETGKSSKKKHRKHKKQPEPSPQPTGATSDDASENNAEEEESEESSSDEESSSSSSSSSDDSEKSKDLGESSPLSIRNLEKSPKGRKLPVSSPVSRSSRSRSVSQDKSRSRSRSRSRTEEREMKKAFAEEKANELQKDSAMEEVKDDSEEEEIPYFPGIQGCRSVEEFTCLNRIEEGTYGVVYRAKDKRTNEIVALKRLKMEREKEGFPITSLREINTLLKGQHPNIVTVREIVVGSNMDKIFIVMDYVEHDLKSLMETMKNKGQNFLPGEVKCLIKQLLQAIGHLHDNWILHRDLKTSNLLLSHKGILKVGDFGLAREYGSPLKHYTSLVVTLWYRAPELLLCTKEYSTPIDIWSVGCIFAEFMLMGALFPGKSEIDQLNKIFKVGF